MLMLSDTDHGSVVIDCFEGFDRVLTVTLLNINCGSVRLGLASRSRHSRPSLGGYGTPSTHTIGPVHY